MKVRRVSKGNYSRVLQHNLLLDVHQLVDNRVVDR